MNINLYKYGEGMPVVFFHGWGFDSQIWRSPVSKLRDHYQIILVDLPGFGQTPVMDWFSFKTCLFAQLPEQYAVVGWSMGGAYALRLALEHPEQVSHLMNIASSPRFLRAEAWPGISLDVFKKFHQNLARDPKVTLNEFLELQGLPFKVRQNAFPKQLPTPKGLELGLNILETWDFREALKHHVSPVCFLFGRLDPIVPVKLMQCMQEDYPRFQYILAKRAAHIPFLSHTDLFLEEIRRFIQ